MAVKKSSERVVRTAAPLVPIRVGARARTADTRFDFWLTLFLRCAAVVWIGEGLLQWIAVLTDTGDALVDTAPPHVAALFFFCVLDFVAAVGLWLVTTWGVAVWMATMLGHGLATAFAPGVLPDPATALIGDAGLLAGYGGLAWLAARAKRRG